MNQQIYDTAKTLHIVGITAAAGMSIIDLILYQYFWGLYPQHMQEGIAIERLAGRLQRVTAIGMMLIIISGITMMYYLHSVWGAQLWFRIKMIVLLLIIINGLSFRRILGTRIHKRINQQPDGPRAPLRSLQPGITSVQIIQLMFFIVIFVLSVFRFN